MVAEVGTRREVRAWWRGTTGDVSRRGWDIWEEKRSHGSWRVYRGLEALSGGREDVLELDREQVLSAAREFLQNCFLPHAIYR